MRKNQKQTEVEAEYEGTDSSTRLHPLQNSTIGIIERRIGRLAGDINLEVSEKMSNTHPVGEISIIFIRCSDDVK